MSDQQAVHDQDNPAVPPVAGRWILVAETDGVDQAKHYGGLLERAQIPFLIDDTVHVVTSRQESLMTTAVHVPECDYERACEIIARDHAETFSDRDDEDEFFDDDDEKEVSADDLDDEGDDPFLDDDVDDDKDDDHLDDDSHDS